MGKSLKYKIGDKIGEWTIIEKNEELNKYLVVCRCGKERLCKSNKMSRLTSCLSCLSFKKNENLLATKIGNFEILETHIKNSKKRKILVRCKCGNEHLTTLFQIKNKKTCKNCRGGYFPGKIINNCTLLERVSKQKWKIRCKCGNIYFGRASDTRFFDCGCSAKNKYLSAAKEKIGCKFGFLKVIGIENKQRHNYLICKCKCGKITKIMNGHEFYKKKSCGCLKKESIQNSENHVRAKFKNNEIIALREFYASGLYSLKDLEEMYSVNKYYLLRIIKREIWKHV